MRLGVDEGGVTELMAVTEHAVCMSTVAAGLLLDTLDSSRALVSLVDTGAADDTARALLDEIAAALRESAGAGAVPAVWRAIAANPHYLESTWRKEQVVMGRGRLAERDKRRVALGVAMNARARYMIEYHAAILRQAGDTDQDLLEVLGVVDHYNALNTLSDGMQIESDIRPPS
jgi:alkylhydroperoxidase/carboxymuconolactone decarboxylase family protein YurZ